MAISRIATATAGQLLYRSFRHPSSVNLANKVIPMVVTSISRNLSTLKITSNLALITGDKRSDKVVNLKLSEPQDRPLVVLLAWLMAKPKHIHKFASYYIDKGFDVLNVNTSPWQLLWPVKGTQMIADELIKFFDVNESYKPIILHGFSVGAYQWGEVLVKLQAEQERYNSVVKRIKGHIWDSAVDYQELDKGVPLVIFPDNVLLQNALRKYMNLHLKTFHGIATQHYLKSSQLFHSDFIKAPALFLVSNSDQVGGSMGSNVIVRENWEKSGIKVQWKCWDDSPHVGHFYYHPKEYKEELDKFLQQIDLSNESRK